MGICSSISSGLSLDRYGISARDKFFHAYFKAVKAGLISNCGEFAIIKIRIVNFFPDTNKFKRVSVSKPIGYEEFAILSAHHVSKTNVVFAVNFDNIDFGIFYG